MKIVLYLSLLFFVGCSGSPNVIRPSVDQNTIADAFQYEDDLAACNKDAYHHATAGGSEGAYQAGDLVAGPFAGGSAGILVGAIQAAKNEPFRREFVYKCLRERGYHVLEETPVASAPQPQPQVTPAPTKVTTAPPEASPSHSKAALAPSPKQLSIEDRLRKLMDLRQKKLITNEEYEGAKKDVLKKLTE